MGNESVDVAFASLLQRATLTEATANGMVAKDKKTNSQRRQESTRNDFEGPCELLDGDRDGNKNKCKDRDDCRWNKKKKKCKTRGKLMSLLEDKKTNSQRRQESTRNDFEGPCELLDGDRD